MTKREQQRKEECRQGLLTVLSPGQLIVVVYKRSRTGFTQHQKWFVVKETDTEAGQQLVSITSNVAVVLGYASSDASVWKAFQDGMKTDSSAKENACYLIRHLYDEKIAESQPFIVETITV